MELDNAHRTVLIENVLSFDVDPLPPLSRHPKAMGLCLCMVEYCVAYSMLLQHLFVQKRMSAICIQNLWSIRIYF